MYEEQIYYGYARISTQKQSIDRQIRNIQSQFPEAQIVQETYTGTTTRRPRWERLRKTVLQDVASGKKATIVFDAVSRMSRNAEEGFALYQELYDAGVELVFLKEHHIDTATYKKALDVSIPETGTSVDLLLNGVRAYLMELAKEQIRIAFDQAEKEVSDLHRRTAEGLQTAKLNGKRVGRQHGETVITAKQKRGIEIIRTKNKDFVPNGFSDADCMRLIGCGRGAYYKYKKIVRESMESA